MLFVLFKPSYGSFLSLTPSLNTTLSPDIFFHPQTYLKCAYTMSCAPVIATTSSYIDTSGCSYRDTHLFHHLPIPCPQQQMLNQRLIPCTSHTLRRTPGGSHELLTVGKG